MMRDTVGTAIVGGGILGLTLALRLRQLGYAVSLFEGARTVGGLATPQRLGEYTWDKFYHVTLLSDTGLRSLLAELDLEDRLRWGITRTGFFTDGRLYSLSSSLEFLRFPPLSLIQKARLALTILRAGHLHDGTRLEGIRVADWLRTWSGKATFDRIWLPLLKSKLGENYRDTSAAFIWAVIRRMYAARRSGLKREMFGYIEGGYEGVLRRLHEHLETLGVEVNVGDPVTKVFDGGTAVEVTLASGVTRRYASAVLTVPTARIPTLCPQLTPAERDRLARVTYQGIVCASFLTRRPLAGYYVTNITDPGVPFTAIIEMTALVDRSRFDGNTLVYLPCYVAADDPLWERSDAQVRATLLEALERMLPMFRSTDVLAFNVARAREVLALSTLNYSRHALPPVRTSRPRIFLVNSAQIANGTLNVNETVNLANAKAQELASLFGSPWAAHVAPDPSAHVG
jgi:protoporphyrinogen oxidase